MSDQAPSTGKKAGPCAMVIFGAAGDLTKRLVIPGALQSRLRQAPSRRIRHYRCRYRPKKRWRMARLFGKMLQAFVKAGGDGSQVDQDKWKWLTCRMSYLQGDLNDPASYETLKSKLAELDKRKGTAGNYLFYLAVAPRFFGSVVEQLRRSGLTGDGEGFWRRVVIEKPFGHDLASAQALDGEYSAHCMKTRSTGDHFLGKETVQNIMMFRFGNGFSSRFGIAIGLTMCKSPPPRRWEWKSVAATTTRQGRYGTWSLTMCFNWFR